MIKIFLRRVSIGLAAAAVLATSASIILVALAFALYALARPYTGPAGAAAIVAGAAALTLVLGALALSATARSKAPTVVPRGNDPGARIMNFVRERPLTAIGGAIAAGFLAIRNPSYLGAAVRSFLEGREPKNRRR